MPARTPGASVPGVSCFTHHRRGLCPAGIERETPHMDQFKVTPGRDGAAISFPKDRAVINAFKQGFPRARWDAIGRVWRVPGKTAARRLEAWVNARRQAAADAEAAARQATATAEIEARRMMDEIVLDGPIDITGLMYGPARPVLSLVADDTPALAALLAPLGAEHANGQWRIPGRALKQLRGIAGQVTQAVEEANAAARARKAEQAARKAELGAIARSAVSTPHGDTIHVSTRYDERIVARLKQIAGARWDRDRRVWTLPIGQAAQLRDALPQIIAWQDEAQAEKAAQASDLAARRFLALLNATPAIGAVVRRGTGCVVVESLGKPFRVDEDMPSVFGSGLLGHEGERCCWVYVRDATVAETAAHEAAEAEAKRVADEREAATRRLAELEGMARGSGRAPDGAHDVRGEDLLVRNRDSVIYGGGSWWTAAEDGLWFVQNNGGDGDDWDHNNVRTGGAGGIGWRLPRSAALEAELRQLAVILKERT